VTHPTFRGTRSTLLTAIVATLAACGKGDREADTGPLPPGTQPIAASARFQPPVRSEKCYSSPVRIVFHSRMEWDAFWTNERRGCTPPPPPAGVDFAKEMLVYAAIGKRMTPLDRISIDGSGVRNDSLIVVIRRTLLMDGCPGPLQPSFPQSLVKIPADTVHPLRFSEEHRRIPCDQS